MRWSNEPVLLSALVAGLLVAVATSLTVVDAGGTVLHAVSVGLLELAAVVGGGAVARQRTYGPKTADRLMDADTVLAEFD